MSQVFDNADRLVKLYFDEVIKPLLPKAQEGGRSSMGTPGQNDLDIEMELSGLNEIYQDSPYDYNGPFKFIHYTNLESIINILNHGEIRLYDLNNMTDPNELTFAFTEVAHDISIEKIRDLKSRLFSFSFCKYDEKDNPDDFEMWRLYGLDGHGIGLVLSIADDNMSTWHHCTLSQIQYGEEKRNKLLAFKKRDAEFKEKYKGDISFSNTHELILGLAAQHKDSIFKNENEVRLLYKTHSSNKVHTEYDTDYDIYETLNKEGLTTHYFNLKLYSNNLFQKLRKLSENTDEYSQSYIKFTNLYRPKIQIEKIILGYRIKNEKLFIVSELIKKLSSKRYGTILPVELSSLSQKFNR